MSGQRKNTFLLLTMKTKNLTFLQTVSDSDTKNNYLNALDDVGNKKCFVLFLLANVFDCLQFGQFNQFCLFRSFYHFSASFFSIFSARATPMSNAANNTTVQLRRIDERLVQN